MLSLNLKSKQKESLGTFYFKVSLLQCNYTFKYWVILINYMYLLYGKGLIYGYLRACSYA